MEELKNKILAAAKREGIDLIGFAPRARFEGVDAAHNPFSIFPDGQTVILVGKRILRGTLRGVEEGTNFGDYTYFGSHWLEDDFLSLACYNVVRAIEDEGFEAVPIFNNPPETPPSGVAVKEGLPAPNVFPDFDYAAVACGLGEIGRNGTLLTPAFGHRQRLQMIITDAVLPPSPLLETPICDGCGKCADACPLGAISKTETHTVTVCGKEMKVAKIDYDKCRTCENGACANRLYAKARPDRLAALCNRTCMAHLEEEGRLTTSFEAPFRKRAPWAIGGKGD